MILHINENCAVPGGVRKVYINEGQCMRLLDEEWNFHFGGYENGYGGGGHSLKPHMSDNKFRMPGRDTGHFGSGTYFSTYKFASWEDLSKYGDTFSDQTPSFIQVDKNLYRVDLDFYKNLYRVRSKRQGDVLFTMMFNLNRFYNRICRYFAKFRSEDAVYDNGSIYQIIRRNADGLGLRCPSYYELTRMAQSHGMNDEAIQSFSTLFMEWNGYNGVNVSGIEYYDNTTHGSVVYDLSKVDGEMSEVSPKNLFTGLGDEPSHKDSIVMNGYSDDIGDALRGEKYFLWYNKLNAMSIGRAMRYLKNYADSGHILGAFAIGKLNDDLAKRYLRIIYVKDPYFYRHSAIYDNMIRGDESKYYMRLIDKYGAYYWVNYKYDGGYRDKSSILVKLLDNFDNDSGIHWKYDKDEVYRLKKEYLDKLMGYMQRDLEDYEKKYIDEEYFYSYDD